MRNLKDLKYYQNYHKHTSLSHRYNKDSPMIAMDYLKYYAELSKLGYPQIYSTVEHGWQGNYFKIYDDLEKFNSDNHKEKLKNKSGELEDNKYYSENYKDIKFIFGTEAYWVKDRFSKDSSNCHMVLLAKNENGRKKLNRAIYESYNSGYYYKNRMDLDLLLSLPKDDIFVTTACVAFWNKYRLTEDGNISYDEIDEVVLKLSNHFTDFYLEVQANNTTLQKEINAHILELHKKYNIPLISATDSHILNERNIEDRDDLLRSNSINYPDEEGAHIDCPSLKVLIQRYKEQGILNDDEIYESIDNTNKILDFEDIVLDRSLKVPVAKKYKHLSQNERNKVFRDILNKEWKLQIDDINREKYDQYISEVKHDIKEIEDCNMADYFIDNYEIMKLGIEKGGILTPSGRGSAVSMYPNKLFRFTKVDKINSPVLMYSERFLTKERILDSKTPPDIDHNVSKREPFIEAQKEVICEEGTFDLLALGTLHYKSAFKMYSRAYNLDPQLANDVTKQIDKYEKALKYVEDEDEKDLFDIYDYVDKEKYGELIEGCQQYMGIVDTLKSHPCGCLAYDGDAIEDIGVIMVRSESTERECFVALLESGTIDAFGYLKQDYLIVDSIGLTYEIYKEIGIEPMSVNKLLSTIENDKKTWDVYRNGYTMCINQAEQPKSTEKVKIFMPKNISELTQWIAGIRPAFKTMYKIFASREHFEYGIKAFDSLIQDEYCDSSFILYQEHLMKVLAFAGFDIGETYTIIKAISKKKDYVIKKAKEKFIPNFAKAIIDTGETKDLNEAHKLAEKVWMIIENSAQYGFNCVSGDTKIMRSSNNGKYIPAVDEMYKIMNDEKYAKDFGHVSLRNKYRKYGYGCALSMFDDLKVRENKIIDITPSGTRQTYEVKTKSGKSIVCTDNHKFPTPNGEIELSKLNIGDLLYCLGKYEHTKFDSSLTNGDFESNMPKSGEMGFQKKENGVSVLYDNFRLSSIENRCCCEICGKKYSDSERFELHHKDLNRKNNDTSNFQWLCASYHKKEHYKNGRTKKYEKGIPTYLDEIVSIEPYKIEQTYNVEMADPHHNFISENGLITSNSAHAYCMAIDSVTLAWQKAYYPLEFYKIALQWYTDKGNKDKVSNLKQEMSRMNISLRPIKFGEDNRKFSIDRENNIINQTMSSLKDMQKIVPDIMYELGLTKKTSFFHILGKLEKTKVNKKSIDILIKLDYFSEFGHINQLLEMVKIYKELSEMFEKVKDCKQINKTNYFLPIDEVSECCGKSTEKMFKEVDNNKLISVFKKHYKEILKSISSKYPYHKTTIMDKLKYEVALLGYTDLIDETVNYDYYIVLGIEVNQWGKPFLNLYQICNGNQKVVKPTRKKGNDIGIKWYISHPIKVGDILDVAFSMDRDGHYEIINENKKWVNDNTYTEVFVCYDIIK